MKSHRSKLPVSGVCGHESSPPRMATITISLGHPQIEPRIAAVGALKTMRDPWTLDGGNASG